MTRVDVGQVHVKLFTAVLLLTLGGRALAQPGPKTVPMQAPPTIKLASGEEIKVLGENSFTYGKGGQAVALRYQTTLKVSDDAAITKEADELWVAFQPQLANKAFDSAVLTATEIPANKNSIKIPARNFVYAKNASGEWKSVATK